MDCSSDVTSKLLETPRHLEQGVVGQGCETLSSIRAHLFEIVLKPLNSDNLIHTELGSVGNALQAGLLYVGCQSNTLDNLLSTALSSTCGQIARIALYGAHASLILSSRSPLLELMRGLSADKRGLRILKTGGISGKYAWHDVQVDDDEQRSGISLSELVDDLRKVDVRGIYNINIHEGHQKRVSCDLLEVLAFEYLAETSNSDRVKAIKNLLEAASARIKDESLKRRARLLNSLDDATKHVTRPREVRDIMRHVLNEGATDTAKRETRKKNDDARSILGREIAALVLEQRKTKTASYTPGRLPLKLRNPKIKYVRREHYHEAFYRLIKAGNRIIFFGGDRGNGKSRLAIELVQRTLDVGDEYVFLNGEALLTDLAAVLAAKGESIPVDIKMESLAPVLAKVVGSQDAPEYVIIDNLDDVRFVEYLPTDSRSTIIITTSSRIPGYEDATLEITPMSQVEASQLARNLLPNFDETDIRKVVESLGYRPLAIVHSSGYLLASGEITLGEFLSDLASQTAKTLNVAAYAGERTLTALYRLISAKINTEYPLAISALGCICHVGSADIPSKLIWECLKTLRSWSDGKATPTDIQAATLTLRRYYLIDETDGLISIHSLTQSIFRELYSNYTVTFSLALYQHIAPPTHASVGRLERRLPIQFISVMRHVFPMVCGLAESPIEVRKKIDFGYTLAVLIKALGQTGSIRAFVHLTEVFSDLLSPERWSESPDMLPAYMEASAVAFATGVRSTSFYRQAISYALELDKKDALEFSLILLDGWIRVGAYYEANEIIGQIKPLVEAMAGSEDGLPSEPGIVADYDLLLAELMVGFGDFPKAAHAARTASTLYLIESYTDNNSDTRRLRMRSLLALLDAYIRGGVDANDANGTVEMIEAQARPLADQPLDRLLEGRAILARIRHLGNSLLYGYASTNIEDWRQLAQYFLGLCATVEDVLREAGAYREMINVSYEWALISWLENPEEGEPEIERHKEYLVRSGNWLHYAQVLIAEAKLKLLEGAATEQLCHKMRTLAYRLASENATLYWYTEALAVAYAAAAWYGVLDNRLLEEIEEGYTILGRTDRTQTLLSAISQLPNGVADFSQEFAYLLGY